MSKSLTIGQVSRDSRVGRDTVRFYEREGLLQPPARTAAGYRQYPPETVTRLRFIQHGKNLGFSLNEIRALLTLLDSQNTGCDDIKQQAETKLADIDRKIADLKRMRETLARLTSTCPGQGPSRECPIVGALEREE
jgi:Hg(II)-responsive transcriptional regulator